MDQLEERFITWIKSYGHIKEPQFVSDLITLLTRLEQYRVRQQMAETASKRAAVQLNEMVEILQSKEMELAALKIKDLVRQK